MRFHVLILLPLLLLAACGTNEPEAKPAPLTALPGMVTFGTSPDEASLSALCTLAGGELFLSYTEKSVAMSWSRLRKLDRDGKRIWPATDYEMPVSAYEIGAMFPCTDGTVLVQGTLPDMFALLSSGGQLAWEKKFPWTFQRSGNGLQLRDGRYAAFGAGWTNGPGQIARLLIYERSRDSIRTIDLSITNPDVYSPLCLREAEDGILIAGGTSTKSTGFGDVWSPFLLRYNLATELETAFTLPTSKGRHLGPMTDVRNGEFTSVLSTDGIGTSYLQRWSTSGTLLSEHAYPDLHISSIARTPDGGYVLTGRHARDADPGAARVVKLDAEGAIQWEWALSRASEQWRHGTNLEYSIVAYEALAQPDGKIVCGGSTNAYGTASGSTWLLRLTADGRVDSTFGK